MGIKRFLKKPVTIIGVIDTIVRKVLD